MTAKEKAKQLYNDYKTLFKHYDANPKLNTDLHEYFKKCASKTVDEMLKDNKNQQIHWMPCENDLCGCYDYWLNVKHEIEKL